MPLKNYFVTSGWLGDGALAYQLGFQDPASTGMEGIHIFNLHLIIVILAIVILVAWLMVVILRNFTELNNSTVENFTHSNFIEIVWTSIPAFVLLSLASPSFSLLYSMDEISNPELTLKIIGHQWYWTYEISDFSKFVCLTDDSSTFKFSSYMLTEEAIKESNLIGFFRNLETNKRVALPTNTHLRLLITSVDVLHSWTIPSFGVKVDACPGRLNQANLFIKRFGLFFGQCSEICGVNHGFMPIVVLALPSVQYNSFLATQVSA
jgi:cytochrome c oxidase subunit 2